VGEGTQRRWRNTLAIIAVFAAPWVCPTALHCKPGYRREDQTGLMPRSRRQPKGDRVFKHVSAGCAVILLALIAGVFFELLHGSGQSLAKFGARFVVSRAWDPVTQEFGAASSIFGTVVSTAIAMVLAVPVSVVIAILLVELAHPIVSRVVGTGIELLAAIPSIIYGMWGLFVFAPFMATYVQPALGAKLGFLPLFQGPPMGIGMLTAGIILALMVLPFMCAAMRDSLAMVPAVVKESAYGMGSTTWEATRRVSLRYCISGMVGAVFLGLGRALGETMAVTFVIGNSHSISASLFAPGNSIASTLANEFAEASEPVYVSALMELGLLLFVLTFVFQAAARIWLRGVGLTERVEG